MYDSFRAPVIMHERSELNILLKEMFPIKDLTIRQLFDQIKDVSGSGGGDLLQTSAQQSQLSINLTKGADLTEEQIFI